MARLAPTVGPHADLERSIAGTARTELRQILEIDRTVRSGPGGTTASTYMDVCAPHDVLFVGLGTAHDGDSPHHPIGEDPTLALHRDLRLARHLDELGFDEFWCGEHHSTGWEIISSPEVFLAAAAVQTTATSCPSSTASSNPCGPPSGT